uniref:coiled-coil domain-containing protein 174 n=1 Tax=Myxine glutinosa TaxID=7769 RepID=UPI00359006F9
MDKKKKIYEVNASSLVDLKAELFRKQQEFQQQRNTETPAVNLAPRIAKPNTRKAKNPGVQQRIERDTQENIEEDLTIEKAKAKLEAKAKLYEQLQNGALPDEETEERYLVDFAQKVIDNQREMREQVSKGMAEEKSSHIMSKMVELDGELAREEDLPPPANPEEEWVDFTDMLGRARRCLRKDLPALKAMDRDLAGAKRVKLEERTLLSDDMRTEDAREKWEMEEQESMKRPIGPVHYEHIRENEVRELGVGYFAFSMDEEMRKKQMQRLNLLREQTEEQREKRERLRDRRQSLLEARLAKVRERRGKPPRLESEAMSEVMDKANVVELVETNPEPKVEVIVQVRKDTQKGDVPPVREWDLGKSFYQGQWQARSSSHWAEGLRNKRPSEFAPPETYLSGTLDREASTHKNSESHDYPVAPGVQDMLSRCRHDSQV